MNCAVAVYAGVPTPNGEQESRDRGEKRKCLRCGRTLVSIGLDRANGGITPDWDDRKYHKKCYREMKEEEDLEMLKASYAAQRC
jgi:hypothetical protein